MAVQFDTGAIAKFRDAQLGSANAIANLDGDKALMANGKPKLNVVINFDLADIEKATRKVLQPTMKRIGLHAMREAKANNPKAKCWDDVAGAVKDHLVGLKRPIMTIGKNGALEPLVENGKPAVRKVTAKDIDAIGQHCADIIVAF